MKYITTEIKSIKPTSLAKKNDQENNFENKINDNSDQQQFKKIESQRDSQKKFKITKPSMPITRAQPIDINQKDTIINQNTSQTPNDNNPLWVIMYSRVYKNRTNLQLIRLFFNFSIFEILTISII